MRSSGYRRMGAAIQTKRFLASDLSVQWMLVIIHAIAGSVSPVIISPVVIRRSNCEQSPQVYGSCGRSNMNAAAR